MSVVRGGIQLQVWIQLIVELLGGRVINLLFISVLA